MKMWLVVMLMCASLAQAADRHCVGAASSLPVQVVDELAHMYWDVKQMEAGSDKAIMLTQFLEKFEELKRSYGEQVVDAFVQRLGTIDKSLSREWQEEQAKRKGQVDDFKRMNMGWQNVEKHSFAYEPRHAVYLDDGTLLVAQHTQVFNYDPVAKKVKRRYDVPDATKNSFLFLSPDKSELFVAGGSLSVLSLRSGVITRSMEYEGGPRTPDVATISRDHRLIAIGFQPGLVNVFNMHRSRRIASYYLVTTPRQLEISDTLRYVMSHESDENPKLYDLRSETFVTLPPGVFDSPHFAPGEDVLYGLRSTTVLRYPIGGNIEGKDVIWAAEDFVFSKDGKRMIFFKVDASEDVSNLVVMDRKDWIKVPIVGEHPHGLHNFFLAAQSHDRERLLFADSKEESAQNVFDLNTESLEVNSAKLLGLEGHVREDLPTHGTFSPLYDRVILPSDSDSTNLLELKP